MLGDVISRGNYSLLHKLSRQVYGLIKFIAQQIFLELILIGTDSGCGSKTEDNSHSLQDYRQSLSQKQQQGRTL